MRCPSDGHSCDCDINSGLICYPRRDTPQPNAKAFLPETLETLEKDKVPNMTDITEPKTENYAYTEFSITVGLSVQQVDLLQQLAPDLGIEQLVLQGVASLQELAVANIPQEDDAMADTMGIVQILRTEFEAANLQPIRIAVRYRESDEWRGTSMPALYTGDGSEFLKNPPPYGNGDGSGTWETVGE